MNAGNVKPRAASEINLEEFERRLRASLAPQAGIEDPLAELTRLVDTIGFERPVGERPLDPQRSARTMKPEAKFEPPPPIEPEVAPELHATEPVVQPPAREPELVAEPELRPSVQAGSFPPLPREEEPWVAPIPTVSGNAAPAARPSQWGLKVGGLIAAAAVMVGAVVVFKVGGHSRSGAPPLILASTAPTKVPPPSADTVRTANESGSLLNRDTAQPTPTAPKLVNTPEAPVDLAARPAPSALAGGAPAAPPSSAASADASPVAPSTNTPIIATVAPSAPPDSPVSNDPSRVKTISVRPDGSLISSGYEANTAAAPPPKAAPVVADADTQPSTPAVALPTKLSPPKSGARVVSRTETTAPADAGDGPAPVAPKARKPKAKPADTQEALKTDDAKGDDATAPEAASGGFAVQLAAPRSEGEAKALIKRLSSKYADAIGSTVLGVRKADRNGETIFRVRAGGLSKEDARAMCNKIKSDGGDCYIAKN